MVRVSPAEIDVPFFEFRAHEPTKSYRLVCGTFVDKDNIEHLACNLLGPSDTVVSKVDVHIDGTKILVDGYNLRLLKDFLDTYSRFIDSTKKMSKYSLGTPF